LLAEQTFEGAMVAIREKKIVKDGKVVIEIPENFGNNVEVIVLADNDAIAFEYWTKEEIDNLGKTSALTSYDLDDEDYSKW
jgi:hypothetical protein